MFNFGKLISGQLNTRVSASESMMEIGITLRVLRAYLLFVIFIFYLPVMVWPSSQIIGVD